MVAMDVRKMASMGQKAMRENQSTAEKLFWPMKAGRIKELHPGLIEAVHIGRSMANRLFSAVRGSGLRLSDADCVLVCSKDGRKVMLEQNAFTVENQDSNDLKMAREILDAKAKPVGVVFRLFDREKGNYLVHARPFELKDEAFVASVRDGLARASHDQHPPKVH